MNRLAISWSCSTVTLEIFTRHVVPLDERVIHSVTPSIQGRTLRIVWRHDLDRAFDRDWRELPLCYARVVERNVVVTNMAYRTKGRLIGDVDEPISSQSRRISSSK